MEKFSIGIVGYGNLGKGVETAALAAADVEIKGVFTRRDPQSITTQGSPVFGMEALEGREDIDVLILCGGSATDIEVQGPELAKDFNTVDSYDTHARIPDYYDKMNRICQEAGTLSLISTGWDPGLFSLNRVLSDAILPTGETYTFWGKGVSQGHSDAVRRIDGVKGAVQYTIPNDKALDAIRAEKVSVLSTSDKHTRVCYVVADEAADKKVIEDTIVTMPNYFADYNTTVHFVSEEELVRDHSGMPHGGHVLRVGETSLGNKAIYEFSLQLGSNPEFTGAVDLATARAVAKMRAKGNTGAITILDVPVGMFSPRSMEELRRSFV